jgi:choline kinase
MDVLILAAGLSSRLSKYTHNLIPKYLIDIDGNTGLYYLIKYWNNHATNIYLVIHSKYNIITKFYINNILPDYVEKIKTVSKENEKSLSLKIDKME